MDEPPIIDEPVAGVTPADADAPAPPELVYKPPAKGKESWRGGSGCGSRLPLYGCIVGVALLIAALMAGTSMMRRTVWLNMDRGRRAVVQALPADLPPAERVRTTRNLEHFRAVLEASKDPFPVMGKFMERVHAAFVDQRLTAEEIEELNFYLEEVIEGSGIPVMQLGAEIRNEELGIRNAALPPLGNFKFRISNFGFFIQPPAAFGGRLGGNSKFLTPNS